MPQQHHSEFCKQLGLALANAETLIGAASRELAEGDLHRFAQLLFCRLMFLRFVECRGWLNLEGDTDCLRALFHTGGRVGRGAYQSYIRPLLLGESLSSSLSFDDGLGDIGHIKEQPIRVPDDALRPLIGEQGLLYRHDFSVDEAAASDGHAIGPEILSTAFESLMTGRYESGSYYTPASVVTFMCREALKAALAVKTSVPIEALAALIDGRSSAGLSPLQVSELLTSLHDLKAVDPACGCGAFLLGLLRELVDLHCLLHGAPSADNSPSNFDLKLQIVRQNLFGVDRDPLPAAITRQRLWLALAAEAGGPSALASAGSNIETADALLGPCPSLVNENFDLVLANPPYLNMFAQQASSPSYRAALKGRFQSARGGFDLFVPFLERGVQLLNQSGVLAYLTPNKLLSAEYAAPIRSLIENNATLLSLADLSQVPVFGAAAYPCITIAAKSHCPKLGGHVTVFGADPSGPGELGIVRKHAVPRWRASKRPVPWTLYLDSAADEFWDAIQSEQSLGDVATISASATVDEAYLWKPAISDGSETRSTDEQRFIPFLVSGNIKPFGDTWATESVRYLKTVYRQPVVDTRHPAISPRRKAQMLSPKVVVSGLALRPTCVWFDRPVACGVATVLIVPHAGIDGAYLAAILNSSAMQRIYAVLFGSLSLSGGYMRFGVPQVKRLPLPKAALSEQRAIAELAKRCALDGVNDCCRTEIDERVAKLFHIAQS